MIKRIFFALMMIGASASAQVPNTTYTWFKAGLAPPSGPGNPTAITPGSLRFNTTTGKFGWWTGSVFLDALSETTAASLYQPLLISGTNIKTINMNSVLGSGDISVGTFTLPALTAGSVLVSNGTTIVQDNANFFYDRTNGRLGLGTTVPLYRIHSKFDGIPAGFENTNTTILNAVGTSVNLIRSTTGDMATGFGPGLSFMIMDNASVLNNIGQLSVSRDGADNTGAMNFIVRRSGSVLNAGRLDQHGLGIFNANSNSRLLALGSGEQFTVDTLGSAVVRKIESASIREYLFTGSVVGSSNAGGFANGVVTDNEFMANFWGFKEFSRTRGAVQIHGVVTSGSDISGDPAISLNGSRTSTSADPINGTQSSVVSSQLVAIKNNGTTVSSFDAAGILTAPGFVKTGGLSTQFLKANGDVDANAYTPQSRTIAGFALTGNITLGSLTISGPLTGTSYNPSGATTIGIGNSAADGSTKGAASFAANDFDASTGNVSIDYTNGQTSSASLKGFLASADWTTFNNKESSLTFNTGLTRTSNTVKADTSVMQTVLNFFPKGDTRWLKPATAASTYLPLAGGDLTGNLNGTTATFSGLVGALNVSGFTSGINTGDQLNISGNANTATALQTSRTINLIPFDGTNNITVTANTPGTLSQGYGVNSFSFNGSSSPTVIVDTTALSGKYLRRNEVTTTAEINKVLRLDNGGNAFLENRINFRAGNLIVGDSTSILAGGNGQGLHKIMSFRNTETLGGFGFAPNGTTVKFGITHNGNLLSTNGDHTTTLTDSMYAPRYYNDARYGLIGSTNVWSGNNSFVEPIAMHAYQIDVHTGTTYQFNGAHALQSTGDNVLLWMQPVGAAAKSYFRSVNTSDRTYDFPDQSGTLALTKDSPIAGSFSGAGVATTTFTVTIGATMANTTYKVPAPGALNILSAALCYITNKTTTTFDVVYLSGLTGTVAFDWSVFP